MKRIYIFIFLIGLTFFYFGCKKSEDSVAPPSNELVLTESSYPKNTDTRYKYSYSRIDSGVQTSGNRIVFYDGNKTLQGTSYKIQIDSLIFPTLTLIDSAYFRTSTAGVYYFIDTTGFAASITDSSLIPLIPFVVFDQELLACSFPLNTAKSWSAFKVNLTNPIQVTVIDVSVSEVKNETISLNMSTGQVSKEALKVRFTLTLRLNPLSPVFQTYTAYAWLMPDIGVAKCEGNGSLVNFITGQGIDLADTSAVINQSLIDYQIK